VIILSDNNRHAHLKVDGKIVYVSGIIIMGTDNNKLFKEVRKCKCFVTVLVS
jgi:hypothetical protein